MKKYLAGAVALFLSHSASALICVPYVSVNASKLQGSWKLDDPVGGVMSKNDRLSGFGGDFFGGCDFQFGKFAVAAEFGGGVGDSRYHYDAAAASSDDKYTFNHYYAIGILPSYDVNGQQLYVRIMAVWGKLRYETEIANHLAYQFNQYQSGGVFGLGILAPISSRFAIRNEYDYSYYSKVSKASGGSTITWKPVRDSYMVGLNFYFMPRFDESQLKPLGHGFYLGLSGGRDIGSFERKDTSANATWTQGINGWFGGLTTGYDHKLGSRIILGWDGQIDFSSANYKYVEHANPTFDYNYYLRDSYALRGKFGIETSVSNELFALGGIVWGHFKKTGGENYGRNFNTYRPGWQVGLGDEFALSKHLSAQIEGTYAKFNSISNTGTDGGNYKWIPTDERASMSLIYTFS
ncbi:MAG: hypothetical protein COB66_07215 [Coxiella sp. (in: Bacteria)]|nr:MAG: hypothetical protein COB66_07215 [Coxiella sp. (in: g-proteobacteria)]